MSGHSKWSTIKRKKGALDAKRGKIFTKLSKEITVAVSVGGEDPDANPRLRSAILNAKGSNMPKDNIQRAINKANKDTSSWTEMNFEGYGPSGTAIFVETLTDNNNRTVSNVRHLFTKHGGSLATNGSLNFVFTQKGAFSISAEGQVLEDLEMELIDAGAEEVELDNDVITITTEKNDFGAMQKKLEELGLETLEQKLERVPLNTNKVDVDTAKKVLKLVELIEDDDDVQNVYHNLEMTEDILSAIE